MKHVALAVVAASVLLPGCAAIDRMGGAPNCTTPNCTVRVIVRTCKEIRVEPEHLHVRRGVPTQVEWDLVAGSQWSFARNGIEFKQATSDFEGKDHQPKKFKWKYRNSPDKQQHYYSVTVTDGTRTCDVDPSIMNN